jgi:hypothetical protein
MTYRKMNRAMPQRENSCIYRYFSLTPGSMDVIVRVSLRKKSRARTRAHCLRN